MKSFQAPMEAVGDLDAEAAATLIAAAADIALSVDADGVVRDVACSSDDLPLAWYGRWLGVKWVETVTVESRPKVEALLQDAKAAAPSRWRHVNHRSAQGADVPILYSAFKVGHDGRVVAVGRDLRPTAALQQRLVEAQLSMERDYARIRHMEARYRLLFEVTSEAVLIVDAVSRKVSEANQAAARLLGETTKAIVGLTFPTGFDVTGTLAIQTLLGAVRATGRPDEVRARLAGPVPDQGQECIVAAALFRHEGSALLLVRLDVTGAATPAEAAGGGPDLLRLIEGAPDGFVVTGTDGRIMAANPAFLELAELASETQAKGESLERWLGRPGVDLNVLVANLRQHGSVKLFATQLRGEYGAVAEIEVSGVSLADGPQPCIGFTIRDVGRRLPAEGRTGRQLPRSVEQLTELVGRVPLKDLVRETTDVIERLCIEAALELTGDNRASAAEILGLSRQSLYVKLRRYGLGDLGPDAEE